MIARMTGQRKTTAVVIGGGLSGLCAAKLLEEQGVDVLVLEARDRLGGRTYTKKNPKCNFVEVGGAYVGPKQNRLLRLAKELGVETYKVYDEKPTVFFRKEKARTVSRANTPLTNPLAILDLNNALRIVDNYGKQIPLEAPWKAPRAAEWDQMTFRDFLLQYTWTQATRDVLTVMLANSTGAEPHEVSFLWYLWFVAACDGTKRIYSVTDGAAERKFHGGSQQLSEKIGEQLGGKVLVDHAVTKIEQSETEVKVTTSNGVIITAEYVILAISPALQMKIQFSPDLPHLRSQLIQRMPSASIIKTNIYYNKTFWREKGLCGMALITDENYPIKICMDDTKPDGSFPSLIGFLYILDDKSRQVAALSKKERAKRVAACYAKVFGTKEALNFVHYEEMNWSEEAWSGGCCTGVMAPGMLTRYGPALREPVGRLYFAGTETATEWSGYMEGAVESGERAAREVLSALGMISKAEIWQTEPSSLDVPPTPLDRNFIERNLPSVGGLLKSVCLTTILSGALATALIFR